MNIIIRDIPESTATNIKAEAARRNLSQQELLSELLNSTYGNPPLVFGYVKLDRQGDIDVGEDCPVCGEPSRSWWLQICNTGEVHLMCDICATSE